jgi:hypothetical protein
VGKRRTARSGAERMVDQHPQKRARGPRSARLCAFDKGRPEFRERLRREAELVRGHASTREANEFLGELLNEMLGDPDAGRP